MDKDTVTTTMRLDKSVLEAIAELAQKQERPTSWLVRRILADWLKEQKKNTTSS